MCVGVWEGLTFCQEESTPVVAFIHGVHTDVCVWEGLTFCQEESTPVVAFIHSVHTDMCVCVGGANILSGGIYPCGCLHT